MKNIILYVEHICGCITEGDDEIIYFKKTCIDHQKHGLYVFMGMAHQLMYQSRHGGGENGKKKVKAVFRRLDE